MNQLWLKEEIKANKGLGIYRDIKESDSNTSYFLCWKPEVKVDASAHPGGRKWPC